ncbi:hypothetical protein QR680_005662 [Steinernema hermaphroditum]|uniref:SRCR domain-containing protein n=1 Tax=Steinernema hermaphroditum TaxID=289476 RepID=A0AA39LW38_9BILA|nr:hypothetical protein QR680_005662 [Steinernema hermaphroditum]
MVPLVLLAFFASASTLGVENPTLLSNVTIFCYVHRSVANYSLLGEFAECHPLGFECRSTGEELVVGEATATCRHEASNEESSCAIGSFVRTNPCPLELERCLGAKVFCGEFGSEVDEDFKKAVEILQGWHEAIPLAEGSLGQSSVESTGDVNVTKSAEETNGTTFFKSAVGYDLQKPPNTTSSTTVPTGAPFWLVPEMLIHKVLLSLGVFLPVVLFLGLLIHFCCRRRSDVAHISRREQKFRKFSAPKRTRTVAVIETDLSTTPKGTPQKQRKVRKEVLVEDGIERF